MEIIATAADDAR